MNNPAFSETFKIHTYEADVNNLVTPIALCQYLQEAASTHAESLGFGVSHLLQTKRTWVLSRLLLEVSEYPGAGNSLKVYTWPAGSDKLFYRRDFEIRDTEERVIGKAVSYWVFLNLEARRPIHPRSGVIDYQSLTREKVMERSPEKLEAREFTQGKGEFRVRYSDLDLNNHVNNIKYVEWMMETLPPELRRTGTMRELEVNFISEAFYGDTMEACAGSDSEGLFHHAIQKNGTDIYRGRTLWEVSPERSEET